jgi:hypothetical protein
MSKCIQRAVGFKKSVYFTILKAESVIIRAVVEGLRRYTHVEEPF